jgi:hypothetical protein
MVKLILVNASRQSIDGSGLCHPNLARQIGLFERARTVCIDLHAGWSFNPDDWARPRTLLQKNDRGGSATPKAHQLGNVQLVFACVQIAHRHTIAGGMYA